MMKKVKMQLVLVVALLLSPWVAASTNIEFLDKETIKSLSKNVFEIVIPKLESTQIKYARELPFDNLNYRERNEKYHSIGTAFFINPKELMSAAHVFSLESFSLHTDIYIRDSQGAVYKINRINHYSNIKDVIVFDLESYPESVTPLQFIEQSDIGDTVFSIGNVQGEGISFRAGQIASFTTEPEYGQWKDIRFTAPASPGNSGGPLVNIEGKVLGLIVKRNSSENHNIAVPSSEVISLDANATFLHKNASMYLNVVQNSIYRDWSDTFKLPKTIPALSKLAQNSVNEFYGQLLIDLNSKYQAVSFPQGERFRAYLRDQDFIKQFGKLRSGPDFKEWFLSNYATKTKLLEKKQELKISKSDVASMHLMIEKNSQISLSSFLNDAQLVMDTLLQGIPLTRTVGKEKVRITSLGAPESIQRWTDRLGRKWVSSLWYMPSEDYFVFNHCLAYPKGAICNLDIKHNNELFYGYLDIIKYSYDEIAIGYAGKVVDWVEYFALDKQLLPDSLASAKIELNEEVFNLSMKNYNITIDAAEINEQSNIHFHFGYSSTERLAEDLLLLEIIPKNDSKFHYRIQKYHSPSEYSKDEFVAAWKNIKAEQGEFTGKIINKNGQFSVQHVIKSTLLTDEEDPEQQEIYVIRCISDQLLEDMAQKCSAFADKVSFTQG